MPQPEKKLTPDASPQHWFGAELRHRRKAEGLTARELGKLAQVSSDMILAIEKGQYPWCKLDVAQHLDRVLRTGGVFERAWPMAFAVPHAEETRADAEKRKQATGVDTRPVHTGRILGRDEQPSRPGSHDVRRRAFFQVSGIAALTPIEAFAPTELKLPDAIGASHISQVQKVAVDISGWDNQFGGGGMVLDIACRAMHWADGLLQARCSEHLRSDFLAAVSRLANVVGATAFDAYAHHQAVQAFEVAAHCAEEAHHWHLRAKSYSFLARQAIWTGRPDDGLTYAEKGLVRADRITPTERAMLHTARARAYGKLGAVRDCMAAVGQADDAFAQASLADEPAWMRYYDGAQHSGDTAHALFDLAIRAGQDPGRAAGRFEAAVRGHADEYWRSRAISRTKLASLTMARSDPRHAAAIGNQALDEAGRLTSRRAADDLRQLGAFAAKHPTIPEARALRARISDVVSA
jgi:transcriptional regulator with XRE-family HTH domain